MSDSVKTILFVSVMMLCVVSAVLSLPSLGELEEGDPTGEKLFPEFTNSRDVSSMSITEYDGKGPICFEVQLDKGHWRISSHGNYPADALQQVSQAATLFSGMEILGLVSSEVDCQGEYGVIDPTQGNLGLGVKGVGTRVVLRNEKKVILADLIIGKPDPHSPDNRYVRRTGEATILAVNMKDNKFTTKFSDWAKKNPLDINMLDLRKIAFEDYRWITDSKKPYREGRLNREGRMFVWYDPHLKKDKWKLENNWGFVDGKFPRELPFGQGRVLNTEFLEQMKSALENLKVVGVVCKSPELKELFVRESLSLRRWKEFQGRKKPHKSSREEREKYEKTKEIYEAVARAYKKMERFGFFITKATPDPVPLYGKRGEVSVLLNNGVKYTFRFGNIVPQKKTVADKKSKEASKDKNAKTPTRNLYLLVTVEFDQEGITPPDLEDVPALPMEGTSIPMSESRLKEIKDERARIKRENEWKQQEYNAKADAGKEQAKKLNARFAGWYFIIPEDVYKKLYLTVDKFSKDPNQIKTNQP